MAMCKIHQVVLALIPVETISTRIAKATTETETVGVAMAAMAITIAQGVTLQITAVVPTLGGSPIMLDILKEIPPQVEQPTPNTTPLILTITALQTIVNRTTALTITNSTQVVITIIIVHRPTRQLTTISSSRQSPTIHQSR